MLSDPFSGFGEGCYVVRSAMLHLFLGKSFGVGIIRAGRDSRVARDVDYVRKSRHMFRRSGRLCLLRGRLLLTLDHIQLKTDALLCCSLFIPCPLLAR